MHPILQEFTTLITEKRNLISRLFAFQNIQTDFEMDLGLLKLEFRFDDDLELDFDLTQAQLDIFYSYLREIDADIQITLLLIDEMSDRIANF